MSVVGEGVNNLNELVNRGTAGAIRFKGTSNKPIKSAAVGTSVLNLSFNKPARTITYQGVSVPATSGYIDIVNDVYTGVPEAYLGGTVVAGSQWYLTVVNETLPNGSERVVYTATSGESMSAVASGLASLFSADAEIQSLGLSGTASGNVITFAQASPTYTASTNSGATETVSVGPDAVGNSTVAIQGVATAGDTVTIDTHFPHLPGGQKSITYTVLSGDSLNDIAAGLSALMNSDTDIQAMDLSTTSSAPATLETAEKFVASATVAAGALAPTVSAVDGDNNLKTVNCQSNTNSIGSSRAITYDKNGNMTSDGTNTYQWDPENRLTKITYPGSGNYSNFTYDGFGSCVKIGESTGNTTQFIWCNDVRCETRDAGGSSLDKFFTLGQMNSGTKYFYTMDHLNSIRELTDSAGDLQAVYDYDPYGQAIKMFGTVTSDFQFASYYQHVLSGTCLAVHRFYNSAVGRWMSRDPIEEAGGLNLYSYVRNAPVSYSDPTGLATEAECQNIANKILRQLSYVNYYSDKLTTHAQIVEDWAGLYQLRINPGTNRNYQAGGHTKNLDEGTAGLVKSYNNYKRQCQCYAFLGPKTQDRIEVAIKRAENILYASLGWALEHNTGKWWNKGYVNIYP